MGKSLRELIKKEISRREEERNREEEERKRKAEAEREAIIWKEFDEALADFLRNFKDYSAHHMWNMSEKDERTAKRLGFTTERILGDTELTVPEFEKGNKRTPAQLKLFKFRKELNKARSERRKVLLEECTKVKLQMEEKNFTDAQPLYNDSKIIYVESKESTETVFEKEVVLKFFKKYKLAYSGSSKRNDGAYNWRFTL